MLAGGDQAGDVGNVRKDIGTNFGGDGGHALEIDDARVGGGAHGDHLRPFGLGLRLKGVVINPAGFRIDPVMNH